MNLFYRLAFVAAMCLSVSLCEAGEIKPIGDENNMQDTARWLKESISEIMITADETEAKELTFALKTFELVDNDYILHTVVDVNTVGVKEGFDRAKGMKTHEHHYPLPSYTTVTLKYSKHQFSPQYPAQIDLYFKTQDGEFTNLGSLSFKQEDEKKVNKIVDVLNRLIKLAATKHANEEE